MIVTTCILIGMAAGMTRSVLSIVFAGVLVGLTFAVASLVSANAASFLALAAAIAGYNIGLIAFVSAGMVLSGRSGTAAA